jgi:2-methylcitrate dehydratase PrpD
MTTTERTGLATLLDWATEYRLEPADAEQVRYLLLDHCANALGGLSAESTTLVRRFAAGRAGASPALGGLRVPEEYAALVAGTSAHALESDDTHQPSSSHPGSAVFPAALALAEASDAGFDTFAEAVVAGYEVMARIGMAATVAGQYDRGFHPTGTTGVFGAAVAAGRLLGLDAEQLRSALGVALSMAAGSMAFLVDGAWTKRLHPGWAAHSGVVAARLAALGFLGVQDPIAGRSGFLQAYSDARDDAALTAGLDGPAAEPLAVHRTSIKAHACCRYNQAPIDAVLALVGEHDLAPEAIARIRVGVLEAGWDLVAAPAAEKRRPTSIVDAQFSLPFGAAVAVLYRSAGTREYRPEVIAAPEVAALMDRVECYRSPALEADFPRRWPAEVELELTDGRVLRERVDHPKGDPEHPLTPAELEAKLAELTGGTLTADGRERVVEAVHALGAGVGPAEPAGLARLLASAEILAPGVTDLG